MTPDETSEALQAIAERKRVATVNALQAATNAVRDLHLAHEAWRKSLSECQRAFYQRRDHYDDAQHLAGLARHYGSTSTMMETDALWWVAGLQGVKSAGEFQVGERALLPGDIRIVRMSSTVTDEDKTLWLYDERRDLGPVAVPADYPLEGVR
jgi:hypothetical protein